MNSPFSASSMMHHCTHAMPDCSASHEPQGASATSMVMLCECVRPSQTSCSSPLDTGNGCGPEVIQSLVSIQAAAAPLPPSASRAGSMEPSALCLAETQRCVDDSHM